MPEDIILKIEYLSKKMPKIKKFLDLRYKGEYYEIANIDIVGDYLLITIDIADLNNKTEHREFELVSRHLNHSIYIGKSKNNNLYIDNDIVKEYAVDKYGIKQYNPIEVYTKCKPFEPTGNVLIRGLFYLTKHGGQKKNDEIIKALVLIERERHRKFYIKPHLYLNAEVTYSDRTRQKIKAIKEDGYGCCLESVIFARFLNIYFETKLTEIDKYDKEDLPYGIVKRNYRTQINTVSIGMDEIKDIMDFIGYNLELVLYLDTVTLYEITKKED